MMKASLVTLLSIGLAGGAFAMADEKIKEETKVHKDGSVTTKEKVKGDVVEPRKVKSKTKVKDHGDHVTTETKIKEK